MKKISVRTFGSPRLSKRNSKSGSIKKLCTAFKVSVGLDLEGIRLPPCAPHNTTQEIIDYHQEILYSTDELLGSILMY